MTAMLEGSDDLAAYFNAGVVPDDEPPAVGGASTDPVCEVCGTPLHYSGRGRKPKFCDEHKKSGKGNSNPAPQRRSATREVDAALASLEQFNAILATGLYLASPQAAEFFSSQQENLQDRNKGVLEANPKLAKQIANAAGKTGPLGLVISYGIVMIPCLRIAQMERQALAEQYANEHG